MKKYITLSLILYFGALTSIVAQDISQVNNYLLNKQQFEVALQGDTIQLVDIRTPKEFEQGTINLAQNIDFLQDDFSDKMQTLDKNRPVYIFCKSGGRSAKAKQELDKQGFTQVYELAGGYLQWTKEGE